MPPRTVRSGGLNGDMGSILERVFQPLILKAYEAGMAFRKKPGNCRQMTRGKCLKDMEDKNCFRQCPVFFMNVLTVWDI